MIAKEFEDFLLAHLDNYLIPSDQLAIFIDSHKANHVVLLLTSNGYSRVPVLTKDKHYLGTISLTDIKRYQEEHNLQEWEMVNRDIRPMTSDVMETVEDNASLNGSCISWSIILFFQSLIAKVFSKELLHENRFSRQSIAFYMTLHMTISSFQKQLATQITEFLSTKTISE